MKTKTYHACSFCEKSQLHAKKLVGNNDVYICDECINLCYDIIRQEDQKSLPESDLIPTVIRDRLDEHVIGQELAKKTLSVAIYNHMKRINDQNSGGVDIEKSNILLIGGSGTGKTYTIQTLARIVDVPFTIVDATCLTESGYVGLDVEDAIAKLFHAAEMDIEKTQRGIVYIDEIDKKGRKSENPSVTRDVSGEGVQQALLKMIEGCEVKIPPQGGRKNPHGEFVTINTKNILFIIGGAFDGLEKIIEARRESGNASMGFLSEVRDPSSRRSTAQIMESIESQDLTKFGIIPELIGRLPIIVAFDDLDEDALVRILTEPKNAIIKQFKRLFHLDGVDLEFSADSLKAIASTAIKRKTGARGLRSIVEKVLLETQYELPLLKKQGVKKICITKENVESMSEPLKVYEEPTEGVS